MFDRFTERARKVMTLARQEAQKLNNDYIGTEHILLGLVDEASGVAAQVLRNLDVDLRQVRGETERLVESGAEKVTARQLPFTPRAKRVLEFALEEAEDLGHNYIGTEHLLLGLVREKDGPAALVFEHFGIKPEEVREEVVGLLGEESTEAGSAGAGRSGALHSAARSVPGPAHPRSAVAAQADLFEVEVQRAIEARFPIGGVTAGADYRRTSLGDGFHMVVHWRPDAGKPPLASISVVAGQVETLREAIPEILELLAGVAVKELRRGRGDATGV